jgi:8-oxo-dGTP diphosphatase
LFPVSDHTISEKPPDLLRRLFCGRGLTVIWDLHKVPGMIDVVCAVIEGAEGRVLACLRPDGKHLAGRWEFPGGKVDPGESPEDALLRELREELAVEVVVGQALAPVEWAYDRGAIRLWPFLCAVISGEPTAVEHAELRWCAEEDFGLLDWAEADLPVLEQIRALRRGLLRKPSIDS